MLDAGTAAPQFTAPNQSNHLFDLSQMRGRWVLLWWYPKADTPG